MPDPGRVFESLDGAQPGAEPPVDDITDIRLASMTPRNGDYPDSFVGGESMSAIPGRSPGVEPPPTQTGGLEQTIARDEGKGNRRTAQERISQLTKRFRSEENRSQALEQELGAMKERIRQQDEQLQAMRRAPPRAPTQESSYEDFSSTASAQPPAHSMDPVFIRDVVREAVTPLVQKVEARERVDALRQEQLASELEAAELVPQLRDPNSVEFGHYRELYYGTDLHEQPDGPFKTALMVRGIMAEEVRHAPQQRSDREPQRRAAQVVTPGPQSESNQPTSQASRFQRVFSTGLERLSKGDDDPDTYIAARRAQRRGARSAFVQEN